ncbi:MAG: response regulator transcription factor [Bacteroidales bacterium]|nr:response regulator transcription factor [Bacteroidales bacterium]
MEKTVKAVVMDDEELARQVVKKYLAAHPEIAVVAECENGFSGLKAIQELKPQLVFLDIQMPKIDGFELLELLEEKPVIIFSTAHDEYAIKAFEYSAADYLLKPYSQRRFSEAVQRALQRLSANQATPGQDTLSQITEAADRLPHTLHRIVVKEGAQVHVIPVQDVIWIAAADDYVEIHTPTRRYLKQKPMNYFEQHLPEEQFVRVHRSAIVAVAQIKKIEPDTKDTYSLTLKDGREINVSRSGMKTLKEKLRF